MPTIGRQQRMEYSKVMAIDLPHNSGALPAVTAPAAEAASQVRPTTSDSPPVADNDQTGGRGAQRDDSLSASAIAADRKIAFRRASLHSWLVRTLKIVLPLSAVGLLGIYGFFITINKRVAPPAGGKIDIGRPVITRDGVAMQNPKYQGFNNDGSKFFVTAKQAFPDLRQPDRITMNDISGTLTQANNVKTYITAKRGIFDNKQSLLDLFERIDIKSDGGLKVQLNSAKVFIKGNKVVTTQPIAAQMPGGAIRANAMTLLTKKRQAVFTGGVAVRLQPKAKPSGAPKKSTPAKPQKQKSNLGVLTTASDKPINITALKLDIDDNKRIALFRNDVRVKQDGNLLRTAELEVQYQGNTKLPGSKSNATPNPLAARQDGSRLKKLFARGNVIMMTTDGRRATANNAEFDADAEVAILNGNVVLQQGTATVTANRIRLNQKAQTALLTGTIVIKQGLNVLTGGRLAIDRKASTSRLTMPFGDGLIRATFYPNAGKPPKPKKVKRAKPKAKGQSVSLAQFKSDPNAPLNLSAHALDINDNAKSAIFSGNVIATQGGITLRTAKLITTYSGKTGMGLANATSASSQQTGTKPGAQLTRLEARKKVLIIAKDGQSASGDWADFDVKKNTVILGGNVVMKKGSAVILGEKLQIDMTTGQARIIPRRGESTRRGRRSVGLPVARGGKACPPGRTCLRLIPGAFEQQIRGKAGKGWGASTSAAAKKGKASKKRRSGSRSESSWQPTTSASETYRAR